MDQQPQQAAAGQTSTVILTQDVRNSIISKAVDYVLRLEPLVIVLMSIVIVLFVGIWATGAYTVRVLVPQYMAQNHAAYERMQAEYVRDRESLTSAYMRDKRELRDIHTAELRQMSESIERSAETFREVAKTQERLIDRLILREQGKIGTVTPPGGGQ